MIQCDALGREKQQKTSDMLRMLDAAKKSVAEWGGEERKKSTAWATPIQPKAPDLYTSEKE